MLITVSRESDTTLRVNVIPMQTKEGENAALSTPLSFVASAEELDRDVSRELASYLDTHRQLGSTLAPAKATRSVTLRNVWARTTGRSVAAVPHLRDRRGSAAGSGTRRKEPNDTTGMAAIPLSGTPFVRRTS